MNKNISEEALDFWKKLCKLCNKSGEEIDASELCYYLITLGSYQAFCCAPSEEEARSMLSHAIESGKKFADDPDSWGELT